MPWAEALAGFGCLLHLLPGDPVPGAHQGRKAHHLQSQSDLHGAQPPAPHKGRQRPAVLPAFCSHLVHAGWCSYRQQRGLQRPC